MLVPKDRGGVRVAVGVPYGPDLRQRLDVYAPRGSADGGDPVVIFFCGGSWSSGTRGGYGFGGRALAAHSFMVIVPDQPCATRPS